jgi:hypothetical protein
MIYLLDMNALVALGFVNHEFHDRVAAWVRAQDSPVLATCSITELGFVRVLAQAPAYGFTIPQARMLLMRLKQASVAPHIHTGPARCFSSSNLGQSSEANYRRSPEQACYRESCSSCNLRRKHSGIASHRQDTLLIAWIGRSEPLS